MNSPAIFRLPFFTFPRMKTQGKSLFRHRRPNARASGLDTKDATR